MALGGGVLGAPGVAILLDLRLLPVMVESKNVIDCDLRPQRSASLVSLLRNAESRDLTRRVKAQFGSLVTTLRKAASLTAVSGANDELD